MAFKQGDIIDLDKIGKVIVQEPELDVFDVVWKIKRLSIDNREISSPTFKSPKTGTEWSVNVGPALSVSRIYISLKLEKAQTGFPVHTTWALHFVNSEMKVNRGYSYSLNFTSDGQSIQPFKLDKNSFMKTDNGYMSDDGSLNLLIRITIHTAEATNLAISASDAVNLVTGDQQCQYKSILENGEFSDLTVATNTRAFPASKIILAGQSPVFRTMFLSDMLESKENVVKIEDFSDETVKGLLEFLYTGNTDSLEQDVVELLKISEKYQVLSLKRECQQILIHQLKKDNVIELFMLAGLYNASELKAQALAFTKLYKKEVADTESFTEMKKSHPEILLDLYSGFD